MDNQLTILKRDARGRVRSTAEARAEAVAEYRRSFNGAALVGVRRALILEKLLACRLGFNGAALVGVRRVSTNAPPTGIVPGFNGAALVGVRRDRQG